MWKSTGCYLRQRQDAGASVLIGPAIAVALAATAAVTRPSFAGMEDCTGNGISDACDIACGMAGGSCDVPGCGTALDCNENGVPDECDLVAGASLDVFAEGFVIPEDIVPTIPPYPPGFIVPDAGLGQVLIVSQSGDSVGVFADGLAAPIGATFAPDEFGSLGNRLFVALRDDPTQALVLVQPSGVAETFASLSAAAFSGIAYVPLVHGEPLAGTLFVADQFDTSGELLGSVHSIEPDRSVETLIHTFGAALFTPVLAPSGFGAFANHMFVSDAMSARLFSLDLQSFSVQVFREVPLTSGQTGLRQVAFSPQGWAGAIDAALAEESVLLVSVAGSIDGFGGVNGAVILVDKNASIVASMTTDSANRPLDPRGLAFAGTELLIANAAEGNILRATTEDFAVHDCNANGVPDSCDFSAGTSRDCNSNHVPDECEIAAGLAPDCNDNLVIDACDIASLASTDCTANGIPDECEADCDGNGAADSCDLANGTHGDENGNEIPDVCDPPPVLLVDADATGANSGLTWTDAFRDLQEAITWAEYSRVVDEIWVSEGTYKPAAPGGDRTTSFRLITGTAIYGGFSGTELSRDQRDPALHATILSGDLNGDDLTTGNGAENSYHVVTGDQTASAILDGFLIVGGNADGTSPSEPFSGQGGGLLLRDGDATIANCRFEGNRAYYFGAALYGFNAFATFRDCVFNGNEHTAVLLSNGGAFLDNCLFEANRGTVGGALQVWTGSVTVKRCVFRRNFSMNSYPGGGGGGAFRSLGSQLTVETCVFSGNESANEGGAVEVFGGSARFTDCTFLGNEAANRGGGLFTSNITLTVEGCILFDNLDQGGHDESAQVDGTGNAAMIVSYSCVQGLTGTLGGMGNIGTNPGFVDAIGPDGEIGTRDDDLRLAPDSPCIDAGPPSLEWIPGETDIAGHPRVLCGRVDMGAFEFGIGDYDCNRVLERSDWAGWNTCATGPGTVFEVPGCEAFDVDANGMIDLRDFAAFQRWFTGP